MKHLWLAVAALIFLSCGACGNAMAQTQVSYCVESTHTYGTGCFATQTKAETFMRENTPAYASLLKLVRTDSMGNGTIKLIYDVEDQPPAFFYDQAFNHGGDTQQICQGAVSSNDPYFPYSCLSEQTLVAGYISTYLVNTEQCTFSNIQVTGAHFEPLYSTYTDWPGPKGYLNKVTPTSAGRRKLEWDIYCTGWGTGIPDHRSIDIRAFQSFQCPDGFRGIDAVAPGKIRYPNVCEPTMWMPYITTRVKQCDSCAKDGNPAIASTGNKEYRSADFTWEGLSFSRAYNSVRDFPADAGFSGNWSHTFSDRLGIVGPYLSWMRSDGYVEYFDYVDSTHYKPQSQVGVVLLKDVDAEVPGSAYRLLRGNTTHWFDTNGRLLQLRSGGKNFHLYYCDDAGIAAGTCAEPNALIAVLSDTNRLLTFMREPAQGDFPFRNDGTTPTVISRVSADGQALFDYHYDNRGRLIEAIPAGQLTGLQYLYAEANLICRNNDGSTSSSCDSIDFPYNLTGVEDESGQRYATYSYDAAGRVLTSEHAGGTERVALNYASNTSVVVSLASGATKTYGFVSGSYSTLPSSVETTATNGVTSNTSFGYSADRLTSKTVNGVRTDYAYNTYQQISATEGLTSSGAATSDRRVTQTDWDESVQMPSERRVYSAANTLVTKSTWTYNTRGQALTASQIDPSTSLTRTSTTTYCEQSDVTAGTCPLLGLVTSINGPRTDVTDTTSYTYRMADEASCATAPTTCPYRKGDLWKVTNALSQVTETLKYDGAGRVLSVKDANGVITDLEYHPRGWLTARKTRGANNAVETDDAITRIEYWPTGLVKKVTQPDGAFTAYTYDAAHRLTDIADNAGNTIHYTLDNAGNRTQEDTRDPANVLKRTLSRVYNQLGQLQTHADAQANPTDFAYDANGNPDTVTDALGRVTDNDHDPLGRLSRTLQDVGGINAQTQFAYDAQDNLTQVTDPKGLSTTYTYNGLGDLTQLSSPDTGTTSYTYDSAGNRSTQTDARNQTSTYSYDTLNRLTGIAYATPGLNVAYTYDSTQAPCSTGETFSVGRLTGLTDASGTTQYCYDRFGHLVRKVQTTNGVALTVRYAYTLAGQLSSVIYPDGATASYVRYAQGRTTQVDVQRAGAASEVLLNQARYYPFGPVAGWTYGNGRQLQRPLNQNYQPTAIHDAGIGGLSVGFQYDPVGNLTQLTPVASTTPLVKFDYDTLSRLTAFKDGPTNVAIESYAYDATGNRQSFTNASGTQAYTYPSTSHRLSQVGTTARTYDNAGNTTAIGGLAKEFVYDDTGRMSQVKQNAIVQMNYAYNGKGEQVRKHQGTANTYTVYDEAGHWLGDYDNTGTALQQAIWLDDLPVGLIANGNQLHYIEPDHLGTPRVVIEVARNVPVWSWDLKSEAFGNSVPNQDPDSDATQFVFGMRFSGQRSDSATGMNYNYMRDYDPVSSRYVQSDPVGLLGGNNTYSYVANAPLTSVDPLGLIDHISGRWIDCGKGCRIRIDISIVKGVSKRHLHWECKGESGACGEHGEKSHGQGWEDAPSSIKECALRHGFAGAATKPESPSVQLTMPDMSGVTNAAIMVGGTLLIIFAILTGASS